MPTNVLMPQLGESIAEGTIVRWMKETGESVGRDEPLFEISTDKVDAEVPSPASGVLIDVRVQAGETVPIDSIVAVIAENSEETSSTEFLQDSSNEIGLYYLPVIVLGLFNRQALLTINISSCELWPCEFC